MATTCPTPKTTDRGTPAGRCLVRLLAGARRTMRLDELAELAGLPERRTHIELMRLGMDGMTKYGPAGYHRAEAVVVSLQGFVGQHLSLEEARRREELRRAGAAGS